MNRISPSLTLLGLSLILCAAPLGAQTYEVIDLGTLGGSTSQARGISNSGVASGYATDFQGAQHAVLWDADGVEDLGFPGGMVGTAVAVNDARQAAGTGEGNPQTYRAYIWDQGSWTDLGLLPGRGESIAEDIDPAGRVVGRSFTLGQGDSRAFLWEDGVLVDLGTLGGSTSAYGINGQLQIVGNSYLVGPGEQGSRAFLWEDGVMQDLGVLAGEDESQAFDINDHADVVGTSWHTTPDFLSVDHATLWRAGGAEVIDLGRTPASPGACTSTSYPDNIARAVNNCGQIVGHAQCVSSGAAQAAFVWRNGVISNLNQLIPEDSGWDLLSARDINDAGEIVGLGLRPNDQRLHAFLLRPLAPTPCGGCDVDADCDDGSFCNGAEVCVAGVCEPGSDPCPGEVCDEAADVCMPSPCDNDGLCEPGEDCLNCPLDCIEGFTGAECGDGVCQTAAFEDCTNCPEDCNGRLNGNPGGRFCCGDGDRLLPLGCGDARCNSDGFSCDEASLGVSYCCGDASCDGDENSANCALDCGDDVGPCLEAGAACDEDRDCCSGDCRGKTCRPGITNEG